METKALQRVADGHYRLRTTVMNGSGLHARVAVAIAETCLSSDCEVRLSNEDRQADGRSVLEMLTLVAAANASLSVEAWGIAARSTILRVHEILSGTDDDLSPNVSTRNAAPTSWAMAPTS